MDLYQVLGVSRDASLADLKKAYRERAKKYHPDMCPGDKEAEEKFKELANAYQVLSDPALRAAYDQPAATGVPPTSGFTDVDDVLSTFGDLFSEFVGKAGFRRERRGKDRRVDLDLTFFEAVWGATRMLRFTRSVACDRCSAEPCAVCQGTGQTAYSQGFFVVQVTCRQCHGTGNRLNAPCARCGGSGHYSENASLRLSIPAGVSDGQLLRAVGKGDTAAHGDAGNLLITLHVQDDAHFQREGANVRSEITLTMVQAALGGELEVPALGQGGVERVTIAIHPGTQPGDRFVRAGQGIPRRGGQARGDHVLVFKVVVPKRLSARQVKLLREFEALGTGAAAAT